MDWLQFLAAVIGHVAWPSVIVVLLVMLRKHIGVLADRLEEFSFGGAKFIWKKKLEEGAEIIGHGSLSGQIETTPAAEPGATKLPAGISRENVVRHYRDRRRKRAELIRDSALGTVVAALAEVDDVLFEIGDIMGMNTTSARSVLYAMDAENRLPGNIVALYETLRGARNAIVHSPTLPSDNEAEEYLRQAEYLKSVLIDLMDKLPDDGGTGKR